MTSSVLLRTPLSESPRARGYSSDSLLIAVMIPLWALTAATSNVIASIAAAILGLSIAGWVLWQSVGDQDKMVRFLKIGAFGLCAILNLGWLMAVYLHYFQLRLPIESSLAFTGGVAISVGDYALALVYALCFAFILNYLGSIESVRRSESLVRNKLTNLAQTNLTGSILFILALTVAQVLLIVSGIIGQRSFIVEGIGDRAGGVIEPWWTFILNGLMIFQILVNGMLGVRLWRARSLGKPGVWIWLILALSVTVVSFVLFSRGRRWLLFCILAHCWWMAFFSNHRPRFIVFFAIFAIFFPILKEVMAFNNFLRSSALELENTRGSVIEVIPEAYEKYRKYTDLREMADEKSENNLSKRPLVAMPLAACMALPPKERSFVWQEEIVNSFIWAIPGTVISNKQNYPVREVLLYRHFPIGHNDTADSMYLSSYISFNWAGVLIYPAFMMVSWVAILFLLDLTNSNHWIVGIAVASWFKFFALDIGESSMVQMFVLMRSSLVLMFAGLLFNMISNSTQNKKFGMHENMLSR